ncbi:MAG: RpiR family transcriptional regulator [Alphaproteobacteria bacterium HGW-Alphaproteobacteria-10]|nr:MAG: RpiR family transcriptional regulator [Alphaproteobacteria bacterium HGW-Alphaproteobacteria-10]
MSDRPTLSAHAPLDKGDARAVGPRIRMMTPDLTPLEARVAEMLLGARDFGESTPLSDVAKAAGVSEAMVVKLAKKLGYTGYRTFRASLAAYNRLPIVELHQELSPDDTLEAIVQKVFRTSIQALEETLAILDMKALARAAELLHGARQRDFYGVGGSAQIARDVSHKFLRIGVRTSVQDDAHMMLMSASLLDAGDVVVAFSHSGETQVVIEAAALARANGAGTIAVTNYSGSTLAGNADVVLCSTAQGSPLMGENAAARIAQLNILDAVFVAVAQRDYAGAQSNLERTMRPVQAKRKGRIHDVAEPDNRRRR